MLHFELGFGIRLRKSTQHVSFVCCSALLGPCYFRLFWTENFTQYNHELRNERQNVRDKKNKAWASLRYHSNSYLERLRKFMNFKKSEPSFRDEILRIKIPNNKKSKRKTNTLRNNSIPVDSSFEFKSYLKKTQTSLTCHVNCVACKGVVSLMSSDSRMRDSNRKRGVVRMVDPETYFSVVTFNPKPCRSSEGCCHSNPCLRCCDPSLMSGLQHGSLRCLI
jgi:hypothetical protein